MNLEYLPVNDKFNMKMDNFVLAQIEECINKVDYMNELKTVLYTGDAGNVDTTRFYIFAMRQFSKCCRGCTEGGILRYNTDPDLKPQPQILVLPGTDGGYNFKVTVDYQEVYVTTVLSDVILYYYCLIYAANLEYPSEGLALAFFIERYLVAHKHDGKLSARTKKVTNFYVSIIEKATYQDTDEPLVTQVKKLVNAALSPL